MIRNIALICPVFPPFRSSASVQLEDLASAFIINGCKVTVITPSSNIEGLFEIEQKKNLTILRVRTPQFRDVAYIKRTLVELMTPFLLIYGILRSKVGVNSFNGVVWYSPSIFFTPLISFITKRSKCSNYLIVRDIFPQWALDLGLINPGILFNIFRFFELRQYKLADYIGVQSAGNLCYFKGFAKEFNFNLEVLHNWIQAPKQKKCSIRISHTKLRQKKIFIYAGNMGVAQDVERILKLAQLLKQKSNVGFLFIGRGSELFKLKTKYKKLPNVLFYDEIPSEEISSLYKQCFAGIVCLNEKHSTHNIPGKFISYLASGLPVLISVNPGNDIISVVEKYEVGIVASDTKASSLIDAVNNILEINRYATSKKCLNFYKENFEPNMIASQIMSKFL